jgi:hypothetical protein
MFEKITKNLDKKILTSLKVTGISRQNWFYSNLYQLGTLEMKKNSMLEC